MLLGEEDKVEAKNRDLHGCIRCSPKQLASSKRYKDTAPVGRIYIMCVEAFSSPYSSYQ